MTVDAVEVFLVGGAYPAWLVAGALDYLCHRRTQIEHTAGPPESWLHLLQFVLIGVAFIPALLFELSPTILALMVVAVALHSIAAYVDTAYTQKRRHISALEQAIHGYMDVLPVVAVALLALSHWSELVRRDLTPQLRGSLPDFELALGIGSFLLIAGGALLEECVRTHRRAQRELHEGFATIK